MTEAGRPDGGSAQLFAADADGRTRHRPRSALASMFEPGDLIVANDAATLPASLSGTHGSRGDPIEVRLAAWVFRDPTRFVAIAFGAGDHRAHEDPAPSPTLAPGDRLSLAVCGGGRVSFGHPRLPSLRFLGRGDAVLAGLARHGRPIHTHVPEPLALWEVWTRIAADPIAFEPPSAGFALDWHTLAAWRRRGVQLATITHAAGISSTGDPALDLRLPFDEPYRILAGSAAAIERARRGRYRIVAVGTSVVWRARIRGRRPGAVSGARRRARTHRVRNTACVVDAILTGIHQPGESHFELLRAFADDAALNGIAAALAEHGYRDHEFGDSMPIERRPQVLRPRRFPRSPTRRGGASWPG